MASESVSIPGLGDLLKTAHRPEDPKRASAAAGNVITPALAGIEAVGDLLWWASQHDDFAKMSSRTIGDAGLLVKFLAETVANMSVIESYAEYELRVTNASKGEFVDIPVVEKVDA